VARVDRDLNSLGDPTDSFTNPVFARSFPDPFVLKFGGVFYGYCTGFSADGELAFPVIRSADLVHWEEAGAAMEPIETAPPFYWAPEIVYADGNFYLYYSCGNEVNMELRVAVSKRPDGGFADAGVRLTDQQFAIDAHVFIDGDGQKYLFYATDFLSHSHIGTGTVVDRMLDWFQLEGNPQPVTRAKYDWQVYDPCRAEKGNVRWHTVEGPSVLKRKGTYFQMFSGGNWKNESYGVGYATSRSPLNSEEWKQSIDGTTILPILRTTDQVLGPGHNSIVLGPNNRELFCVYHSWVNHERVMSLDRLDVVDDRMILLGPTVSGQPLPFKPRSAQKTGRPGARVIDSVSSDFFLETTFRLVSQGDRILIALHRADKTPIADLEFVDGACYLQFSTEGGSSVLQRPTSALDEYQCLGIELNGRRLELRLNGLLWFETDVQTADDKLRVAIECSSGVEMLNLDLTEGFVDLFEGDLSLEASGWRGLLDGTAFTRGNGEMMIRGNSGIAVAAKGPCFSEFESAFNLSALSDSSFGFALLTSKDEIEILMEIANGGNETLSIGETRKEVLTPPEGARSAYNQYRFVKQGSEISVDVEGFHLARYKVSSRPNRIGIVTNGSVLVEMARMIRIDG